MNIHPAEPTALVRLPVRLVEALRQMRDAPDFEVLEEDSAGTAKADTPSASPSLRPDAHARASARGKYAAAFLGAPFAARTLPDVFAVIVDMTAQVAPETLETLSNMSARTRRYVARKPEAIHPGNRSLPVMQTNSGWWISKNIGREDLTRGLIALCIASGLKYGVDVQFSLPSGGNR